MALRDEQADILGGPILQRPKSGFFIAHSQYHFVFKSVTLFSLCLLLWIACARGLEHLKKHRELRYKKAMRRQHGIPDSDCRPFAVAYAAAKRTRLEREAQERRKLTNMSDHNLPAVGQRTNAQKDARALRRRISETTVQQIHDYQQTPTFVSVVNNKRPEAPSVDFVDRHNPDMRRRVAVSGPFLADKPSIRRASRNDFVFSLDGDNDESRKRSFEDESDGERETTKKSRIDGNALIDGDERADWYTDYAHIPPLHPSNLNQQTEVDYHVRQQKSKCISELHSEGHDDIDEAMQGIDEDEVSELNLARGKKRDRTEAGSTFGGDDDEDIRNGRASHHRKRRTVYRRGADIPPRRRKRGREIESPDSEGEENDSETLQRRTQRSSKKKRGKKAGSDEASEISLEDSHVSRDPLCGGRRVGDEWEADGIHYKVGGDGERLRLTLVKKARNKFHMPQDSQHPDRSAALEIYVETWMTEEQYNQAEGRREFAWQEVPRESSESKIPDALDSLNKNGKNLLWDSVRSAPSRRSFRQSKLSGMSARINPFEQWPLHPPLGRRVASSSTIISPILPGVADIPIRPGFRGFSKWEKQDREAEAMARIRAKVEEQKKAQEPSQKPAEMSTNITVPELDTKPLSVPSITLTPPAVVADNNRERKSTISAFSFATTSNTSDSTKGVAAVTSSSTGPSLPSASIPVTTTSMLFPGASTIPSTTPSAASSLFSFSKPSQAPPTTQSSAIPNFFVKTSIASTSSASPSPPVIATQPQPPSTESSSKASMFSFAKPDTTSSVVTPVKPAAPIFGAPSGSSLAKANTSFTSAPSKVEGPVLPGSTPTFTSEGSQSTAPLFSFSGPSLPAPAAPSSAPSMPLVPKFSFGQPPTTAFATGLGTGSQLKPTFKFGQSSSGAINDPTSTVPTATPDESKKLATPVSVFGTTTDSNEPVKSSPFGTPSTFGGASTTAVTNLFAKPTDVNREGSASTSAKPITTINNPFTSVKTSAPDNTTIFSFGGTNSGPGSVEESKPTSSFGGAAGSSDSTTIFSGSSLEGKPAFTLNSTFEASRFTSNFGGSAESFKPTFMFGRSTQMSKTASVFGGTAEGSKAPFVASGVTLSSEPSNVTDSLKPPSNVGSTVIGSPSFSFDKKDEGTVNTSNSMSTPTKSATSFAFTVPSGSMSTQPSPFVISGTSSQSIFAKPPNTTPVGTSSSGPSNTFIFGKPAAQNQHQEQ